MSATNPIAVEDRSGRLVVRGEAGWARRRTGQVSVAAQRCAPQNRGVKPVPWLAAGVRLPGDELGSIWELALARWRAGARPAMAVGAALLCVAGDAAYTSAGLRHVAIAGGAVTAALPLRTELERLPGSAFLPTAELPLPLAVIQVVLVLGLAELALGRRATAAVAITAHLASTLVARVLISVGTATMLGLPASQAGVLDTGPSAMTAAVGSWLLLRTRAYWCLGMLGTALTIAAALQNDVDGREHLAAFGLGVLAALALEQRRSLHMHCRRAWSRVQPNATSRSVPPSRLQHRASPSNRP
jgi:hypothetical protein